MILGDPNRPPQPSEPPKPEMAPPECGRCGEEMELGYIPDHGHCNVTHQPEWSAAKFVDGSYGLTLYGRRHQVRTYRCPGCGYLESYAPER
jgi:Domain of unknown function (DUF6487)